MLILHKQFTAWCFAIFIDLEIENPNKIIDFSTKTSMPFSRPMPSIGKGVLRQELLGHFTARY
jgi:hypothetical protein